MVAGVNNNTSPRNVVVGFRVRPETALAIRKAARRDGRSVSGFLARFVERVLVDDTGSY